MKKNLSASKAINALGGTAKVARLFDLSMPSVSAWRKDGIPHARMMFLRLAHAAELQGIDLKAATGVPPKGRQKKQQVS